MNFPLQCLLKGTDDIPLFLNRQRLIVLHEQTRLKCLVNTVSRRCHNFPNTQRNVQVQWGFHKERAVTWAQERVLGTLGWPDTGRKARQQCGRRA